jgi:hypothetical protein
MSPSVVQTILGLKRLDAPRGSGVTPNQNKKSKAWCKAYSHALAISFGSARFG